MVKLIIPGVVGCIIASVNAASIPLNTTITSLVDTAQLVTSLLEQGANNTSRSHNLQSQATRTIEPRQDRKVKDGIPPVHAYADLQHIGGDDTWITIFRVLMDKSGSDTGVHSEINGWLHMDYDHNQPTHFFRKVPKNTNFKINKNDHGREIFEYVVSSQGKPTEWINLRMRERDYFRVEKDFFYRDRVIVNEDKDRDIITQQVKESGEEKCFEEAEDGRSGYAARLCRCIWYVGYTEPGH